MITEYKYRLKYSSYKKAISYLIVYKDGSHFFRFHTSTKTIIYLRNMFKKLIENKFYGMFYINIPILTFSTYNSVDRLTFGNVRTGDFIFNYFSLYFNVTKIFNSLYFYNTLLEFLKDNPKQEITVTCFFDNSNLYSHSLKKIAEEMRT